MGNIHEIWSIFAITYATNWKVLFITASYDEKVSSRSLFIYRSFFVVQHTGDYRYELESKLTCVQVQARNSSYKRKEDKRNRDRE